MGNTVVCLHHNDADGLCSGAIVRRRFGDAVTLFETDYGLPVPWDEIETADTVILTDFSLSKADMLKIYRAKGSNFIWVDHHLSAIKDMADIADIPGVRDLNKAACVLTWEYFFPHRDVPPAVQFIGDRDIWRFEYPQTRVFCEGLFYANTAATNDALWDDLFNEQSDLLQKFMNEGKILLDARLNDIARRVQSHGFEVTFEGYRTLAINLPSSGDVGHHICSLGYDVAYVYSDGWQNERIITKVTLYSETVDVSVLAKAHGGGGHRGAAGFQFVRQNNSPLPPGKLPRS